MEPEQKIENEEHIEETSEKIIDDELLVKIIIALFTAIAFVTSVAYLFAYWSTFEMNIFEFVDVSNIIKYSILPLILGTGFVPLFALFLFQQQRDLSFFYTYEKMKKDWQNKKYQHALIISSCLLVMFIVPLLLVLMAQQKYALWEIASLSFAFSLMTLLSLFFEWGKRFIPNPFIRSILFFLIIYSPSQGFAMGRANAEAIKRGDRYRYVEGTTISEEVRKWDDDKIRYIGTMSDYFFFLLPSDKSIYIAAKDDLKPFILKRYDRQKNKE